MIVADASVVVDMLLGPGSEAGDALSQVFSSGGVVCAPHLVDAEVGQVLRRFVLAGQVDASVARLLAGELVALPIERYSHTFLLGRALQLLDNVTVYDAIYLALAEALECPLLTGDAALAGVPGVQASVRVFETSA